MKNLDYNPVDGYVTSEGKITRLDAEYSTDLETELVEITLGSRRGDSYRENEFGEDDFIYTVKPQSFEEKRVDEVKVPESVAYGSVNNFAEHVLEKYAEVDNSEQWEMEGLDELEL